MNGYEIRNKQADSAVIYVYDLIGEGFEEDGITAKQFAKDIKDLGSVREINLRINSPGGSMFEGKAMANVLRSHPAKVIVDIDGICGSAATYMACAGDMVRMAFDAVYMIHEPSAGKFGNASTMRRMAEALEVATQSLIETYVNRTKLPEAQIRDMVNAETWMTAQEAKAFNFVDEITGEMRMAATADLSKLPFKNIPAHLVNHQAKEPLKLVAEDGKLEVVFEHEQPNLQLVKSALENMGRRVAQSQLREKVK